MSGCHPMEQGHGQLQKHCCPDLMPLICGYRVLKIPWTEKITNEEVLRMMGTCREIVRQFKTRKLQHLRTYYKTVYITTTTNRGWNIPWLTKNYLDNGTGAKYYELKLS